MLIVSKKHHGINIIDCWYAERALKQSGVIRYQEALKPIGEKSVEFLTLVSDLTEDAEAILSHFTKNCRYEVRRAERERVECSYLYGKEITRDDITQFVDFFEDFWQSKGVHYAEKEKCRALIEQYAAAGAFAITKATVDGRYWYIIPISWTKIVRACISQRRSFAWMKRFLRMWSVLQTAIYIIGTCCGSRNLERNSMTGAVPVPAKKWRVLRSLKSHLAVSR